jgi:hypothetical protein
MTDPGQQFRNDASQKEREQILRNDQRVRSGSTFLDHTHSEEGGRFAKPTNVIGSTPTPTYPAGPNWSVDPTGVEPPLGIDVNAVEAVGEKFEIEALGDATTETVVEAQSASSLAGATATASVDDPSRTGGAEAPTAAASPRGEPPAIPNPKPTRGV